MKKLKLLLSAFALTFGGASYAQTAATFEMDGRFVPVDEYQSEEGNSTSVYLLPMTVNVTKFITDNGIEFEEMNAFETKMALFGYSYNDLESNETLDAAKKNKLLMTVDGSALSFSQKMILLKNARGSYQAFNFLDVNIGAAVKLGDEFYIQLEAYAALPGFSTSRDDSGMFAVSDAEFNEFKDNMGCYNCDSPTTGTRNEMLMEYGARFNVKYKRFGLSLYNSNYYSHANASVMTAPTNPGTERGDTERLVKNSTVREFGVEVTARLAQFTNSSYISAIAGYSVAAHVAKTYKEQDVYVTDEEIQATYTQRTNRSDYSLNSTPSFNSLGMLKFGIRLNF